MNELESYYEQNNQIGGALGMIQRGEIGQRQGALAVKEAKDDITDALQSEKEKVEDEGGGIGMGAGLLTKEGGVVIGKKLVAKGIEKARGIIQGKVNELIEAKTAGHLVI